MASSEGWTEKTKFRGGRSAPAAGARSRSLKDALSAAGLDEAERIETERPANRLVDVLPASPNPLMTPRLAFFEEADEALPRVLSTSRTASSGVVSPAPWQRAASRGRRRTLLHNTFGWVMTLVVAGTIIGLAGRYLAVPPHLQTMQQARQ